MINFVRLKTDLEESKRSLETCHERVAEISKKRPENVVMIGGLHPESEAAREELMRLQEKIPALADRVAVLELLASLVDALQAYHVHSPGLQMARKNNEPHLMKEAELLDRRQKLIRRGFEVPTDLVHDLKSASERASRAREQIASTEKLVAKTAADVRAAHARLLESDVIKDRRNEPTIKAVLWEGFEVVEALDAAEKQDTAAAA